MTEEGPRRAISPVRILLVFMFLTYYHGVSFMFYLSQFQANKNIEISPISRWIYKSLESYSYNYKMMDLIFAIPVMIYFLRGRFFIAISIILMMYFVLYNYIFDFYINGNFPKYDIEYHFKIQQFFWLNLASSFFAIAVLFLLVVEWAARRLFPASNNATFRGMLNEVWPRR